MNHMRRPRAWSVAAAVALTSAMVSSGYSSASADSAAASVIQPTAAVSKSPSVQADDGKLVVTYITATSEGGREAAAFLKKNKVLEEVAAYANDRIALPYDIPLMAKNCGFANAFWSPEAQDITYCYEFVDELKPLFEKQADASSKPEERAKEVQKDLIGLTNGVLFHELGHGLISLYDLPVTGKEEDAVDQLSTLLLASGDDEHKEYAVSTINAWAGLSQSEDPLKSAEEYADEHSLNAQRFYNWACWLYGSDPTTFQSLVDDEVLPAQRAERCQGEFEQIDKSWGTLLQPYLKTG